MSMSHTDTIRVTVTKVERLRNSRDGGPRFRVFWKFSKQSGMCVTKSDAQIGSLLTGDESGEYDITTDFQGHIVAMTPAS